jgi:hypothetical protein
MGRRGIHIGFRWESHKEKDQHQYLDIGGRISMDWIDLAQDRGQWGSLVNTAINLVVP